MKNRFNAGLIFLSALLLLLGPIFALAGTTNNDKTSAADVGRELHETLNAIGSYTAEQRAAAVEKAKEALAKTDAHIDQVQQKIEQDWQSMSEDARHAAKQSLKDLRHKRTEIAEWYGGLKHSSANAWDKVKKGFSSSYQELEESLEKGREKF